MSSMYWLCARAFIAAGTLFRLVLPDLQVEEMKEKDVNVLICANLQSLQLSNLRFIINFISGTVPTIANKLIIYQKLFVYVFMEILTVTLSPSLDLWVIESTENMYYLFIFWSVSSSLHSHKHTETHTHSFMNMQDLGSSLLYKLTGRQMMQCAATHTHSASQSA